MSLKQIELRFRWWGARRGGARPRKCGCEFGVLGNRGMQGLGVRIARALNRMMGKSGAQARFIEGPVDPFSSAVNRERVVEPRTWLLGERRRR